MLHSIEKVLLSQNAARVYQSLSNINHVVKYVKGKDGYVILNSGKEIMVSVSKKSVLLSYFK